MDDSGIKKQFRLIADLLVAIERVVLEVGPMDQDMVKNMGVLAKLSPLGMRVLADFVNQSEKLKVRKIGDKIWVQRNPKYKDEPGNGETHA